MRVSGSGELVGLTLKFLHASPPGPPAPVRSVLAPQPSASNSQRLPRPQGAAAKSSSQLPIPSAIPRPASRMPLTSRSVPPGRGALPPDSVSTRKGLPRPTAAGHRVRESGHKATKSSCHGCHSQQSAAPQESGSPRTYQVKRSGQQARLQ